MGSTFGSEFDMFAVAIETRALRMGSKRLADHRLDVMFGQRADLRVLRLERRGSGATTENKSTVLVILLAAELFG